MVSENEKIEFMLSMIADSFTKTTQASSVIILAGFNGKANVILNGDIHDAMSVLSKSIRHILEKVNSEIGQNAGDKFWQAIKKQVENGD